MKRKRLTPRTVGGTLKASLTSYGNDDADRVAANLPKIPGLQIEYVPSFLHVLRVTSKFFQAKSSDQPFTLNDWERLTNQMSEGHCGSGSIISDRDICNSRDENTIKSDVHKSVHDALMHRLESISNNSGLTSATALDYEVRQREFVDVVMAWLDEVKILARQRKQQQIGHETSVPKPAVLSTTRNQIQQPSEMNDEFQPIPYSMFLYLWELQQQHKRVKIRRSALFLSGLLLLRSKDCRHYLGQETHLADWISNIGTNDIPFQTNDRDSSQMSLQTISNRKLFQQALLQREAIALISLLVDKGFGKINPKLPVAAKSLRHRCISGLVETSDSTLSNMRPVGMARLRSLRDFALLHGHEEVRKTTKLLNRADECLEMLVPRIAGVRHHRPSASNRLVSEINDLTILCGKGKELRADKDPRHGSVTDKIHDGADNSESDEDSIDWEDGGEIESDDAKPADNDQNLHISAVERTVAVMKQTSGPGGNIEIDFDRQMRGDYANMRVDVGTNNQVSNVNSSKKKLEKLVEKLSNKHFVRLSAWLDGLRNADNLCGTESASLVSISQEKNNLRLYLIKIISTLKQDISRIISSASQLNIQAFKGHDEFRCTRSAQTCKKDARGSTVLPMRRAKVLAPRGKIVLSQCAPKKNRNHHRNLKINIKFKKNRLLP